MIPISYPQPTLQNFPDHMAKTPGKSVVQVIAITPRFLLSRAHVQVELSFENPIFSLY